MDEMLEKKNVVGVGYGYKNFDPSIPMEDQELALMVMVDKKLPLSQIRANDVVPDKVSVKTVNGEDVTINTDIIETGEFVAQDTLEYFDTQDTSRYRPAPGGSSIGHFSITAGTFGCVVYDRVTGERLILSNNHVLANSNDAKIGDAVLQPGPYDGGKLDFDTIGELVKYKTIHFQGETECTIANSVAAFNNFLASIVGSSKRLEVRTEAGNIEPNLVDAAVAKPIDPLDISDEILGLGRVNGVYSNPLSLGLPVYKRGRTTDYTENVVLVLDATVDVSYGSGKVARFERQIISGDLSRGGDSGSLVMTEGNLAVGLLFAGSNTHTIFSPIEFVLDLLEVEFR